MKTLRDGRIVGIIWLALSGLLLAACVDDGTHGELDAKPIYGDLSGLYYGTMCKSGSAKISELRSRAIRVTVNEGECAVLYLDGVDQKGRVLLYPGGDGGRLDCHGLAEKLKRSKAHARVVDRAQAICGTS